jgi:hypothetical protein
MQCFEFWVCNAGLTLSTSTKPESIFPSSTQGPAQLSWDRLSLKIWKMTSLKMLEISSSNKTIVKTQEIWKAFEILENHFPFSVVCLFVSNLGGC